MPPPSRSSDGTERSWQEKVWEVFEKPNSSWTATGVNVFIFLCILASTATFVIETLPTLQGQPYATWFYQAEIFFVCVFSTEYILRFLSTPDSTWVFVTNPMNMIDLLAILPFFIELYVMSYMGSSFVDLRFLRVIRLARILRLMKVGKYSTEIQILGRATWRSWEAMVLLVCLLGSAVIVFGAIMYVLERGKWNQAMGCYVREGDSACSPFESIPLAFYWGVTTMTTVGYGDTYPITPLGKVVACCAMIAGVFIIALPVAVMGDRFVDAYSNVTDETKTDKMINDIETDDEIRKQLNDAIERYKQVGEKCSELRPRLKELSIGCLVKTGKARDEQEAHQRVDKMFDLLGTVLENAHNDMMQYVQYQMHPHASPSATPLTGRSAAGSATAASGVPGAGEGPAAGP